MGSGRRKNPMKKSTIIKIAAALVIAAAAGFILVRTLRTHVSEKYGSKEEAAILSAQVTSGSISTTVSGSGTLTNEESEDTFIPGTVEVTEIYVKAGDSVEKGDMLASVNSTSVVKAMKEVQDQIDRLDEKIDDLEEEDKVEKITAGVDGRIKKIYVESGDSVADVMYDNNALMLISVDGSMAVDVETDSLKEGEDVTVRTEDGTEYSGSVESVWAGKATVLIGDNGPEYEDTVTVANVEGEEVGAGKLYIHEQVSVTGFTGVVDSVKVYENKWISAGNTLMTINDASSTVNYATLLEQRGDLEDSLQDLIVIYKEGAVYAREKGMVTAITETEDSTTTTTTAVSNVRNQGGSFTTVTEDSDSEEGTTISICPTNSMLVEISVDETDILSLKTGQEAEITVSSMGEDAYSGTVTGLDTVGNNSNGVTTYTATLTLDRKEGMLEGMSASAVIMIEGKENALLLPVDAVNKTSSSYYVYRSYNTESGEFGGMTEVTTGLSNAEYIEVNSGLSEGDTVYYTEAEDDNSGPGGMNFGGGMPGSMMPGGNMPGGNRPGGGSSGGGMPGGNRPGGGSSGGGMPGGR